MRLARRERCDTSMRLSTKQRLLFRSPSARLLLVARSWVRLDQFFRPRRTLASIEERVHSASRPSLSSLCRTFALVGRVLGEGHSALNLSAGKAPMRRSYPFATKSCEKRQEYGGDTKARASALRNRVHCNRNDRDRNRPKADVRSRPPLGRHLRAISTASKNQSTALAGSESAVEEEVRHRAAGMADCRWVNGGAMWLSWRG